MALQANYKNYGISSLIDEARDLVANDMENEAVLRLRKAIRLSPNNIEALLLYAQISPSRNNARRTLDKILNLDPTNTEAQVLRQQLDKEATWDKLYKPAEPPPIPAINKADNKATATRLKTTVSRDTDAKENKHMFWLGLFTALFGLFGVASMQNGQLLAELAHLLG